MAAQNSFLLAEEELSCPICFEEFNLQEKNRQPKLLLCLHTFCLSCMETLRKYDGSLQCSICRTSHHVYKVSDLMDNYVIFEHLKVKQEYDDEKLAVQLKQEYEESVRVLMEQEERDAMLAREEEEKNRLEMEKRKQEEERRIEEENSRKREEEERRLSQIEKETQDKLKLELELKTQRKRLEIEKEKQEMIRSEVVSNPIIASFSFPHPTFDVDESSSSDESTESGSGDTSDSESDDEDDDDDDDESFQDLEPGLTDGIEDGDDASPTSIVDQENYETLSSDTDQYSVYTVSSDEEPNHLVFQSRSNPNSPEPNLLSEEFSGVAQTTNPSKPPHEPINNFLRNLKLSESTDDEMIYLGNSMDKSHSDGETINSRKHNSIKMPSYRSMADEESDPEGARKNGYTPSSSPEDERHFSFRPQNVENDECKLQ